MNRVEPGMKLRDKRTGEIFTAERLDKSGGGFDWWCGDHIRSLGIEEYYKPIATAPQADPVAEAMEQFDKLREQVKAHAAGPGDGPTRSSGMVPKGTFTITMPQWRPVSSGSSIMIPMTTVDNAPAHTSYIVKDRSGNTGTGATMDEAMANMSKSAAQAAGAAIAKAVQGAKTLADSMPQGTIKPHACRLSLQGAACIVCLPTAPPAPWRSSVDEFDLLPDAAEGWRR